MNDARANDTCIVCHSQGRPLTNRSRDDITNWAVGYDVRKDLKNYWKLEDHTLGETTFTHFPDGTAPQEPDAGKTILCKA